MLAELSAEDTVEMEGFASLNTGKNTVYGKLFLTDKKVIFTTDKKSGQFDQIQITYDHISQVVKQENSGLFKNDQIKITTSDGNQYDFSLEEAAKWQKQINDRLK
ncbi:GRAM domain-containing protein [Persicobacter diffluens]|uniref:GRAM domain-containing protein n=1 Tax=Persicobacter diffluens TaxID=981 RepID=A0AAN5AK69_9BACT|nr:hypothetical protein PEDI_30670 [Persicobacter diffluens]